MNKITLDEVEAAGRELEKDTGKSGRWFYVYIKSMFYDAEKRNAIAKSPLRALAVPQPNERDRVLSEVELRLFLIAAHDMQDARGDQYEMLARVARRRSEVSEPRCSSTTRLPNHPSQRARTEACLGRW